jgi:hypothetical protein
MASRGEVPERTPLAETPHFAFYSDFAINLNDALIAAATERRFRRPELFQSGAEESCFSALPPSTRAGWGQAVDYYAEHVVSSGSDREVYLLRLGLLGWDEDLRDTEDRQFVEITGNIRAAAAPAYEACRWATQDEENRRWINERSEQLATYEGKIALRLEELYQKPLERLPIPVDVVETVNFSGANTILKYPAGGHLLISSSYEELAALEIVFHETSHTLMGRSAPVRVALADAASALDVALPRDLWHVVLFYTTGEAVRSVVEETGDTEYAPMIYEIFDRGTWVEFRDAVESSWPAYLNGERTLSEAASDLMRAIGEQGSS